MGDLRVPIGSLFGVIGLLLVTVGGARSALSDVPVNLYAGISMIVFAAVMLGLAYRKSGSK